MFCGRHRRDFFSLHTHFGSPVGTGEALANILSLKITFGISSLSLEASLVSSSVVDSAAAVALSTSFLLLCQQHGFCEGEVQRPVDLKGVFGRDLHVCALAALNRNKVKIKESVFVVKL